MPSPITGIHVDETVQPVNDMMGRENIEPTTARPTLLRQRSNVQKVEDDDEFDDQTKPHKPQTSINGLCEIDGKHVKFSNNTHFDSARGSDNEGIDFRQPETPDEEECAALTDDKQCKRERHEKKKRNRRRWIATSSCLVLVFLIAAGALGLVLYNHFNPQQNTSDDNHGILYCYSCDMVHDKDIVTYKEDYNMCCVGKNAELKETPGVQISPLKTKEMAKGNFKVKFQEIEIDFRRCDKDSLGLRMLESHEPFSHQAENSQTTITIDEDGLYMVTLTLTATAFNKHSTTTDKYFRLMSCIKFQKGNVRDEECRKITLLPKMGNPFEIHKTKTIEKGTIIRVTVTDVQLIEQKPSLNKLTITQLNKS